MSTIWTLAHEVFGGRTVEKTLDEWGISNPQLRFTNLGRDELTFNVTMDVDAGNLFDLGTNGVGHRLILKKQVDADDAVPVFIGTITSVPRSGTGQGEDHKFTVAGPWYMLEELILEQPWMTWNGTANVAQNISTITLGLTVAGVALNSKEQIKAVLDYAKTVVFDTTNSGFRFTYNFDGFPTATFPWETISDTTCAEAIKKVLRWTPNAIGWWDYSTEEGGEWSPTFRCKRRSDLVPVSLSIGTDGSPVMSFDVASREDIMRTGVVIHYATSTEVNGEQFRTITTDKYPPTTPLNGVRQYKATVEMEGPSLQIANIACQTVLPASADWWRGKLPWLQDASITSATVESWSRQSALPRELLQGQVAPWMYVSGSPIQTYSETVSATITVEGASGTRSEKVTTQIVATNGVTGSYRGFQSYGQAIPVGLAEHFYNEVNTLHWQGTAVLTEEEWSGSVGLGNVLNFTGTAKVEWETMRALVWEVSVDLERGHTTVSFGPSENLGPRDLIDLARANRNRLPLMAISTRVTGISQANQLGGIVARQDSSSAPVEVREFLMSDPTYPGSVVELKCSDIPADSVLKARLARVCVDGVWKNAYIAMTEPVPIT